METYSIELYSSLYQTPVFNELEEALRNSSFRYSLRQLNALGVGSSADLGSALQQAMHVCALGGFWGADHFKPVYVVDAETGETRVDWLMSKMGFNLTIMQLPVSENTARWLCELADV